jgi:hypothetical protein
LWSIPKWSLQTELVKRRWLDNDPEQSVEFVLLTANYHSLLPLFVAFIEIFEHLGLLGTSRKAGGPGNNL